MKKRPYFLIGVIGLSTSHFHISLLSIGEPAAMSLVIEPEIKAEDLLEEVVKQIKDYEFEAKYYYQEVDNLPPCVKVKEDYRCNHQRPPKSIKPRIKPRYPQSKIRR